MEKKYKGQTKRIWYQMGYRDALRELKIGDLRQWINEDRIGDPDKMITNEQIEIMLGLKSE